MSKTPSDRLEPDGASLPRGCDAADCDLPAAAIGVLLVDESEPQCAYCADCIKVLGGDFRVTEPLWWGEVAFFPRGKYVTVEREDGWHLYTYDDGTFS